MLGLFICQDGFGADSQEYLVKAAFLEKLTHFVDWPAVSGVAAPSETFSLCVFGRDPFGATLDELAVTTTLKSKSIRVHRLGASEIFTDCDLLFISRVPREVLRRVLDRARDRPMLTVADEAGHVYDGAMISFSVDGARVGFNVNLAEAHRAGFKFSSRLIKLAGSVVANGDAR